MKKVLRWFPVIIMFLVISGYVYNRYNQEPEYIEEEKAIEIAQNYITRTCSKEYLETILNYHSPQTEMRYVNRQVVHLSGKGKNIIDSEMCWCIIFSTPQDKFIGPQKVYIAGVSGEVLGTPYRM